MAINLGDSKIGHYQIDALLSTTPTSTLYRASTPGEPEGVVLKSLSRDASPKPDERQQFLDEVQALTDLRSEFVLSALDSGTTDDDRPFVVLEDADRGSLVDRLESGSAPNVHDIDHLVEFLAGAIEDLHANGLTIGQANPENVLIRSSLRRSSVGQGMLQEDERYVLSDVYLRPTDGRQPFAADGGESGLASGQAHPPFNQDQVRLDLTTASMLVAQVVCGSKPSPTTSWATHLKNESRFPELNAALIRSLDEDQEDHPGSVGLWSESLLNRPPPPLHTRVRREFAALTARVNRRQGQVALMVGAFVVVAVLAVALASWLIAGDDPETALPSGPTVTATESTSAEVDEPLTKPTAEVSASKGRSDDEATETSPTVPPSTSAIGDPTTTASSSTSTTSTTTPETTATTDPPTTETGAPDTSAPETTETTEASNATPQTEPTTPETEPTTPETEPTTPETEPTVPETDPTTSTSGPTTPTTPTTTEEKPDIPPEPVTDLRVLSATENSVTVGWSKAPGAVGYQMVNHKDPEEALSADQTSHTFTGNIGPGRNYLFEVATLGSNDRISPFAAVPFTTPGVDTNGRNTAMNPTGISASSTANSITVSWQNVPDNDGYAVFLSHKTNKGGTAPNETEMTISGLEPNRAYLVEIRTQFAGPGGNSERVPIVVRTKG